MSSGSTFILYRKYAAKAPDDIYSALCKQYVEAYKENGLSNNKTDEEFMEDLPPILDFDYGNRESVYDEQTQTWKDIRDYSIDGQRKNYLALMRDGKNYLDKLLDWSFTSSFTCLKNEWVLNSYSGRNSEHIVSIEDAKAMLQACNYLLSGKWSDEFENILDNKWISIIATGNDSDSYWKYVYRNDKKRLREIDDEESSIGYYIKKLQTILTTYVGIEKDYSSEKLRTEPVLLYLAW